LDGEIPHYLRRHLVGPITTVEPIPRRRGGFEEYFSLVHVHPEKNSHEGSLGVF
jgi:hypothetical protein